MCIRDRCYSLCTSRSCRCSCVCRLQRRYRRTFRTDRRIYYRIYFYSFNCTYQELIAIVQNNHPLADRGAMYLSDLNGYRLTTYRDTIPIGKVVYKLLKKKGAEAVYSYDDEISIHQNSFMIAQPNYRTDALKIIVLQKL